MNSTLGYNNMDIINPSESLKQRDHRESYKFEKNNINNTNTPTNTPDTTGLYAKTKESIQELIKGVNNLSINRT